MVKVHAQSVGAEKALVDRAELRLLFSESSFLTLSR